MHLLRHPGIPFGSNKPERRRSLANVLLCLLISIPMKADAVNYLEEPFIHVNDHLQLTFVQLMEMQ